MTRRISLLVNPHAGRGHAGRLAAAAAERLRAAGVEVDVLAGPDATATAELARGTLAAGTDALVAVGGDGMVHLALQLVAGTGTPLGVLPGGTGNDVARMLGIPRADPVAAVDLLASGVSRRIDLGRAGDTWFATVLASGFDSRVNDRTNRMRWPRGRARYNLAILAELAHLTPLPFTVKLDDETLELDAMLVAVGNGSSYGGGMHICPDARPDDGLLDVTVISAAGRAKLVRTFPSVYQGTHVRDPGVHTFRSRTVRLSSPGVNGYADGEPVASLPVAISCVPGAVSVLAAPAS